MLDIININLYDYITHTHTHTPIKMRDETEWPTVLSSGLSSRTQKWCQDLFSCLLEDLSDSIFLTTASQSETS